MNVVQRGASSAEIVKAIFDMHIGEVERTLDLTYGEGTFWKWDGPLKPGYGNGQITIGWSTHTCWNYEYKDFRATHFDSRSFDVVVFDPPFTANGPSKEGHQKRYGADRSQDGAPQNIHEVRALLAGGLVEAMRLSKKWVLLKTQDVVESGKLHLQTQLAMDLFAAFGFKVVDYVLYEAPRRPQPDAARGSKIKHFRERPSVFMLAQR